MECSELCEMNNCMYENFDIKDTQNIFNLWVLIELENFTGKTEKSIKNYRFNEAANDIQIHLEYIL